MNPRTLVTLIVAAGLTVAAAAHEKRDDDPCDRRREERPRHSCREERCGCSDAHARHERRDRRECEPPVYATVPLPAYYYAVLSRLTAVPDGRFHPVLIPGRPVYVLPGTP